MKKSLRTIIPVAVTAVIIAACLWIPSLFFEKEEQGSEEKNSSVSQQNAEAVQISDAVQPLGTRLGMWRSFWNGDENYYSVKASIDELDDDAYNRYDSLMEKIEPLNMFFLDNENNSTSSVNYEYIVYYDDSGTALRLFHIYREWTGDWSNWTELYFDADDAVIYYFYVSSGCRANYENYLGALEDYQADGAADLWATLTGMELQTIQWSGEPADAASVGYVLDGVTLNCRVNWIYYESNLFDFKILVT